MTKTIDIDPEAEASVLGALLVDSDAYDVIADIIRPELFGLAAHRFIAEAAIALHREHKPIDPVLIHGMLAKAQRIPNEVPVDLVYSLSKGLGTASNVRYYAETLRDLALRRAAKDIAHSVLASSPTESGVELLSRVAARISDLETRSGKPVEQLGATIIRRLEEIEAQYNTGAAPTGVMPTGFVALDNLIGGFHVGHLTTIAARPGVGKTAFVSALADRIAKRGPGVCIFQLEDYSDALANRAISRRGRIGSMMLRDGRQWRVEHWDRVNQFVSPDSELPIWVDDQHGRTIHDIAATMRRMTRQHGVKVFVLDNLSEVIIESSKRGEGRLDRELGIVARTFRDAANALGAVPVMLVHLNRESEKREGPPRLSDLKNSGDIEDASHLVMMLHQEEEGQRIKFCIEIPKHRNGAKGKVALNWIPNFMSVED